MLAVPYAVFKRFGEHDGGRLAAVVSYYSFFSVFPLLLVFVTVLGIVLQDNEELRDELVDGALGQIPVIGSELASAGSLPGSGFVLALGIVTALWAGPRVPSPPLQQGLDVIADVPVHERGNFFVKKVTGGLVPRRCSRSAWRCRPSPATWRRSSTSARSPARSGWS